MTGNCVCGKPSKYKSGECNNCYRKHWRKDNPAHRAYMKAYRSRPDVRNLANLTAVVRYWSDPEWRERVKVCKRRSSAKYRAKPENRERKNAYMRARRALLKEKKHELEQRDCGLATGDVRPTGARNGGR